MLMPVFFTFLFLWYPAGVALYWLINNVFAIGQQYLTNYMIGPPKVRAVGAGGRRGAARFPLAVLLRTFLGPLPCFSCRSHAAGTGEDQGLIMGDRMFDSWPASSLGHFPVHSPLVVL